MTSGDNITVILPPKRYLLTRNPTLTNRTSFTLNMNEENTQDIDLLQDNNEETATFDSQDSGVDVEEFAKAKAEAAKWKAIAQRNRKPKESLYQPVNKQEPIDEEIIKKINRLDEMEKKRQFGFENSLSPEETDFIFKVSGGAPKKESLEDPNIKIWLEGKRQAERLSRNIPSSSSNSFMSQGKSFNDMTDQERKSAYEERAKAFKK